MIDSETERKLTARLRRIKGQVGGVERMIQERQYCIDILHQITAVQKALEQVSLMIVKNHIETCVSDAVQLGSELERARKMEELMEVFSKFGKLEVAAQ